MGIDCLGCVHRGFFAGAIEIGALCGKAGSRGLFGYCAYCGDGYSGRYCWSSWSWTRHGADWDEYCTWSIDWSSDWWCVVPQLWLPCRVHLCIRGTYPGYSLEISHATTIFHLSFRLLKQILKRVSTACCTRLPPANTHGAEPQENQSRSRRNIRDLSRRPRQRPSSTG